MSSNVVLQTAFLGDLLLSIPTLKKIKELYPNEELILICKKGLGEYFVKEKIVDKVFEVKKGERRTYKDIVKTLNAQDINHVFCMHRSVRSQLTCFKLKAKRKIGFWSWLGYFVFDDQVAYESAWPDPLRQLKILTPVSKSLSKQLAEKDWSFLNRSDENGNLPMPPDFAALSHSKSPASRKVALFPGSVWATKKWTEQGFVDVANIFLRQGYQVFLMGGPEEKALCESIQKNALGSQVLAGSLKIGDSIDFIRGCDLVICNDSAPTHMASVVGTPVVTIFGPTTLNLGFRPWTEKATVVEMKDLGCRPCGKHGHDKCPLGHHFCMKQITAEDVVKAAERYVPVAFKNET